jgi:hypothetical protein
MEKVKEAAPESKATATPQAEQQPKLPEQKTGPQMLARSVSAALPPPDGTPPAARAGEIVASPESGFSAPERARMSKAVQRTIGNARFSQLLNLDAREKEISLAEKPTRPKQATELAISSPNSPAEQEAEMVAQQVISTQTAPKISARPSADIHLVKQEEKQKKPLQTHGKHTQEIPSAEAVPSPSQREEQKALQTEPSGGSGSAASTDKKGLVYQAIDHKGSGKPLEPATRSAIESGLGADLSAVRVHADEASNKAADALNARAFTQGKDVFLGQGESDRDKRLMAHEMTHVVQQGAAPAGMLNRQAGTKNDVPKAPTTAPGSGTKGGAPPVGEVAPGIIDLKGNPDFKLDPATASFIDEKKEATVNARFGKFADGPIKVYSKGSGKYQVDKAPLRLTHPLFTNLGAMPAELQPTLIIMVRANKLSGEVGLGKHGLSEQLQKLDDASAALGLVGFDLGKLPKIINTIEGGSLHVGMAGIPFRLGGVFQGQFSLDVVDEKIGFEGNANVNVKGLATGALKLERSPEGLITGKANIALELAKNSKNYSGSVDVVWDGEAITGEGKVGYQGEKLSGEVILRLMDRKQADQLKKEKQAPPAAEGAVAAKSETPAKSKRKEPINYVVFGEGDLTFSFTEWLNGTAHVIVDHEGYLTIIGKITPQKEYIFLEQKDYVKQLFKVEARASYGLPVVGNIFIFANASLDAFAKLGPGKLYNIVVEGTYSTDPKESKNFSIQASLNISAAAGIRLRGEAGAGLEILSHDIKAGAGINGILAIRGYADATPVIGYREKASDGEDKKGEFFIRGDLEIAAQPFLGLSGDLFIELDTPWWSPLSDDKWTWPLFNKEWPLGGSFGMLASVDYVLGSKEFPKVDFKPVDFSADKFFTDLYQDKAQPKSKEAGEQKGDWKEKNSQEAAPPEGGGKGEVAAGKAPAELPAGKSKVQPGGPKKPEKPVDPNAKTAEGKSVKQLQEEAAKKGKKPEGKEVAKGAEGKKAGEEGKEKPADAKVEAQKWERGVAVVKQALAYAEREGIDLQELNQILKSIKKRKEYGFSELYAKEEEDGLLVLGSMSPDGKQVTKVKKKDAAKLPPTQVAHEMSGNRAGRVTAEPLTKKAGNTKGSSPKANIPGWAHAQRLNKQKDEWVRLHLLNENLHGPGEAWNLTPGTKTTNSAMTRGPEEDAKTKINKGMILFYESIVSYHDDDPKFPDKRNFPKNIIIKWGQIEDDGKSRGSAKTWDSGQLSPPPEKTEVVTVNINKDGRSNMQQYLKISEYLARNIVEEREENGPFATVDFESRMQKRTLQSFIVQWPAMVKAMLDPNIEIIGFTDQ